MNGVMQYKGYTGSVEFSEIDKMLYGKVQGIRSLISYEGESVETLLTDFHDAIDSYLESCKANNDEPEIPYKGSFNVRVKPELHQKAAIYAMTHGSTLNRIVEESMATYLSTNMKMV